MQVEILNLILSTKNKTDMRHIGEERSMVISKYDVLWLFFYSIFKISVFVIQCKISKCLNYQPERKSLKVPEFAVKDKT